MTTINNDIAKTIVLCGEEVDEYARYFEAAEAAEPTYVGELFIRFMSRGEYLALIGGKTLRNNRAHSLHALSDSEGFCFMRCPEGEDLERFVNFMYEHHLAGIVSRDVCVALRNVGARMRVGHGVYADPYGSYYDTVEVEEFSTTSYTSDTMRIERVFTLPKWWGEWR